MNSQAVPPKWIMIPFALVIAGNIAGWFGVGLHTDEAYYWVWSQRLDWGYFDHPPLIAWLVRLFTELFGNNLFAVRLPAVIAWLASTYVVFRLSIELFRSSLSAWVAVLVFVSLPIFQVGFHVIGPDSPLMLFTSLAYLFVYRAITSGRPSVDWTLAGLCVGLAMLGKYTAVLVPAAIFTSLVFTAKGRQQLLTPWPWLAGIIALAVFSPVIAWNAQNEWASFLFQWGHGTETNKGFALAKISTYLLQQMSSVLPWILVAMAVASIRLPGKRTDLSGQALIFLVTAFWFPLLFFGITGSISKSMHNWPVIAYIPGSVLLGGWLGQWVGNIPAQIPVKKWIPALSRYSIVLSAGLALTLVNLIRFPQWANYIDRPVIPQGSAVAAIWGWDQLGKAARRLIESEKPDSRCRIHVIADRNNAHLGYYHAAGQLAYQLGNADRVSVDPVPHFRQYNLWQEYYRTNGYRDCLLMIGPSYAASLPKTIRVGQVQWQRKQVVEINVPDRTVQRYAFFGRQASSGL